MTDKVSDKKNLNKGKVAIIGCVLMIIVLLVIIVILLQGKNIIDNKTEKETKRNVVVNKENVDKVVSEMKEEDRTPIGSYQVTMNAVWKFDNADVISNNAYVENVESNTNSVYFDVVRKDNGETIFASPILPVGTYLENIMLDKKLTKGTYDCVCTYHLLDENDEPISKVSVTLTVVIEN